MVEIKELTAFCKRVSNTHTVDDTTGEIARVYVRGSQGRRKGANCPVVMHVEINDQTAEVLEHEITERLRSLEYTRADRIYLEVLAKGTSRPILDRCESRPYIPDVDDDDEAEVNPGRALARTESAAVGALAGALVRSVKIVVDRLDEQDRRGDLLVRELVDTKLDLARAEIELRAVRLGQADEQWDRALAMAEKQLPAVVSAIALGVALKGSGDAAKVAGDPKQAMELRVCAACDVLASSLMGGEETLSLYQLDTVQSKLGAVLLAMPPTLRVQVADACALMNAQAEQATEQEQEQEQEQ